MILNEYGRIADTCLLEIPDHFPYAKMHQFVVMPNHIHCIVEITVGANNHSPLPSNTVQANDNSPLHGTSKTIGSIVRGYKTGVTKWLSGNTEIHTVWQRNYYEHIIRDEKSYHQISEYIQTNPLRWQDDKYCA